MVAILSFYLNIIETESDRELARDLYYQYRDLIFRISLKYLNNEAGAEDAVSDVFEKICRNVEKFRNLNCSKAKGLIVIYTKHTCLNILKRGRIIAFTELDEEAGEYSDDAESIVICDESYNRILSAVEALDDKYKDVLRLKYFVGFSDSEIAEALDINTENVRVRLHRARVMIKNRIKETDLLG